MRHPSSWCSHRSRGWGGDTRPCSKTAGVGGLFHGWISHGPHTQLQMPLGVAGDALNIYDDCSYPDAMHCMASRCSTSITRVRGTELRVGHSSSGSSGTRGALPADRAGTARPVARRFDVSLNRMPIGMRGLNCCLLLLGHDDCKCCAVVVAFFVLAITATVSVTEPMRAVPSHSRTKA